MDRVQYYCGTQDIECLKNIRNHHGEILGLLAFEIYRAKQGNKSS